MMNIYRLLYKEAPIGLMVKSSNINKKRTYGASHLEEILKITEEAVEMGGEAGKDDYFIHQVPQQLIQRETIERETNASI